MQFLIEYLKFLTTPKLRQTLSELMSKPLNSFHDIDEKMDEKFKEILALKEEEVEQKNVKIQMNNLIFQLNKELASKKINRLNFYDDVLIISIKNYCNVNIF